MIIQQQQNDIVKSGFDSSKKATINQDKLAKLQHLLTKGLYSDPISAVLVEWTNNAVDSVVQAGKNPIEHPVLVKITENKLIVEDKGTGLNKEEFETVCMSYLSSTKEESNDQIGAFGIGMKSFMSLDRAATFTCRKNGYEWKFLAYQGVEFMEYDLISEKPTTEENGVICEITLQGWQEVRNFKEKAQAKLAYYDTVVLNMDGQIVDNNIIRSEKWQYSNQNKESKLHLCLKDVFYKIDYDRLGISAINIPIALRFNLNEGLQPTPSRESLIWNTHTINLVKEKIKRVATWFVNKYNESVPEEQELLKVFKDIDNDTKVVKLADKEFVINSLLQYSSVKPKELKIKGINIKTPKFYYDLRSDLLDEYETLVDYNRGKWGIKHVKTNHNYNDLLIGVKHIEVDKIPTGNVKKYLLNKYRDNRVLFIKKTNTRRLGSVYNTKWDSIDYRNVLNLVMELDPITKKTDKSKFRPLIQEWQFVENQFKSLIINETWVEETKSYQEWLAKHKEQQKNNRKSGIYSGNHKVLNKQQGQVTLAYAIDKSVGKGYKFDKTVRNINELHKQPGLTILFTEEQKELALQWRKLQNKWKIAIIGKNEAKKIENIHNHITYKQFMEKSKVFKRLATSFLFWDIIEKYNDVYFHNSQQIIQELLKPFAEDIQKLKDYATANGKYIRDNEVCDSIKAIAKEQNLYDYELWDVYQRVIKNVEKYNFISLIKNNTHNSEDLAKIKTLINQILYHRKMYHNQFEELEITVKQPEVTKIEEETILEEQLETV